MEREKEWNERIGEKLFVCKREWELKKLKAWKLEKEIEKISRKLDLWKIWKI